MYGKYWTLLVIFVVLNFVSTLFIIYSFLVNSVYSKVGRGNPDNPYPIFRPVFKTIRFESCNLTSKF